MKKFYQLLFALFTPFNIREVFYRYLRAENHKNLAQFVILGIDKQVIPILVCDPKCRTLVLKPHESVETTAPVFYKTGQKFQITQYSW